MTPSHFPSHLEGNFHEQASRERLLALLTKHSYQKKRVVLASGRESDFFIDCKQTLLLAEGHALSGLLLAEKVRTEFPNTRAVAGVELGGCPLASAVATVTALQGSKGVLDAIYVRKAAKDHGSKRLLEGDSHLPDGAKVVVLEDVATTGGSSLAAIEILKSRCEVLGVIAVVDRQEGAEEAFAKAGIPFRSLFVRSDFPL